MVIIMRKIADMIEKEENGGVTVGHNLEGFRIGKRCSSGCFGHRLGNLAVNGFWILAAVLV